MKKKRKNIHTCEREKKRGEEKIKKKKKKKERWESVKKRGGCRMSCRSHRGEERRTFSKRRNLPRGLGREEAILHVEKSDSRGGVPFRRGKKKGTQLKIVPKSAGRNKLFEVPGKG